MSPRADRHGQSPERLPADVLGLNHARNERRAWIVAALCALACVLEIAGGLWVGSMGVLAEGLHTLAHVAAMAAAGLAYAYARRHVADPRFVFGPGKLGDLCAFASALILAGMAALIALDSLQRLLHPAASPFEEAMVLAAFGMIFSGLCAFILRRGAHGGARPDATGAEDHEDLNIRAAYLHFMADVGVSVLAMIGVALGGGLGWLWADPVAGLAGAAVTARFSLRLLKGAGLRLLDAAMPGNLAELIAQRLAAMEVAIKDLRLWSIAPGRFAAVISVEAEHPRAPQAYKAALADLPGISFVSIEVETRLPAGSATNGPALHIVPGRRIV
jgi:cation diffusion facilitator family transporter